MDLDGVITFNIGGRVFQTHSHTLKHIPNTRLARLNSGDIHYNEETKVFFYDRNPDYFSSILDFYRFGELHFDHSKCGPAINRELNYWEIDENCISSCCWQSYRQYEEDKKTIAQLQKVLYADEGLDHEPINSELKPESDADSQLPSTSPRGRLSSAASLVKSASTGWQKHRNTLWRFLDNPGSSLAAKIWSLIVFILILTSIMVVIMETHPFFRVAKSTNTSVEFNLTSSDEKQRMFSETEPHQALNIIDGFCISVFVLELFLRFFACPSKLKFFKGGYNIIDIFCVLPLVAYYLANAIDDTIFNQLLSQGKTRLMVVMIYFSLTSVLRVFRLFKLARHYRALKILTLAVLSSLRELSLLVLLISMGTLIFSTLIYFAEFSEEGKFEHIPIGFWWSTITMTTVGYGDMYPHGTWGYIVGITCAIAGMLITGLPIPIIANNFNRYYTYARLTTQITEKMQKEKKLWNGPPPAKERLKTLITLTTAMTSKSSALKKSNGSPLKSVLSKLKAAQTRPAEARPADTRLAESRPAEAVHSACSNRSDQSVKTTSRHNHEVVNNNTNINNRPKSAKIGNTLTVVSG